MPKADLLPIGTKMGRLLLIEEAARQGPKRCIRCRCDCGAETLVLWQNLKRGASTSCGCYAKEINTIHGGSRTHIFEVWSNMHNRCNSPKNRSYDYYGGRGISVCADWESFHIFKAWAESHGYQPDLTIERRNVSGNYEPSNCYWADRFVQAANKTKRRGCKAPYIGVGAWGTRWSAHITQYGKRIRIGVYNTPEEARDARNEHIKQHNLPHTPS